MPPTVTPIDNTVVDADALYVPSFDTLVNTTTFNQALISYGNWQFTAWYGANRNVRVARRWVIGGGQWQAVELPHALSANDAHNTISLGLSPDDGRLHIACDTHVNPVTYIRSVEGILTDGPGEVWTFIDFDAPTSILPGDTDLGPITYPTFATDPDGELQMFYRVGDNSNAQWHRVDYEFDIGGAFWAKKGAFTSATGTYTAPNGQTSLTRGFYPWGFTYDVTGRLHMAGTWREKENDVLCASGSVFGNHHLVYLYSDDRGTNWRRLDNTLVATIGTDPLKVSDLLARVDTGVDIQYGLINSEGQHVFDGRLYAAESYVPGRLLTNNPKCVTSAAQRTNLATASLLWVRPDRTVGKSEVKLNGADFPIKYLGRAMRSQVVVDAAGNVYMILHGLRIVGTAPPNHAPWTMLFNDPSLQVYGECLVDSSRLLTEGIVSIGYQRTSTGSTSAFCVRDFHLGT